VAVVVVETGRAQVLGGIAQELPDLVGVGDTCTIHQGHDACHVGSGEGSTLLIGVGVAPADDVWAQDAVGLAVAGVAARCDHVHLRPVVGIPRQPLAAVHRPDAADVRVGGRHGHPPAAGAGARHEHDALADRVLDLLVDEGVVVRRVPGQAHVDDVGAVVDRPTDPLPDGGHGPAVPGAHDPYGHDGHGPVDARDSLPVVGHGADDAGHHGAVAQGSGVVGVVGGRLVAGKIAPADDPHALQVGVV